MRKDCEVYQMLMKMCAKCKKLIPFGTTYCDECAPVMEQAIAEAKKKSAAKYNKAYNKKRDPKYVEFYRSKEWHLLRNYKLTSVGYQCERCKANGKVTLATEIHHIEYLSYNWDKRLDINNLQALCTKCHNEVHQRWGGVGKKV